MKRRLTTGLCVLAVFCLVAAPASAERITVLNKPYTPTTMKQSCIDNGGSYWHNSAAYGCDKACKSSSGENDTCSIRCKGSKCTGYGPS